MQRDSEEREKDGLTESRDQKVKRGIGGRQGRSHTTGITFGNRNGNWNGRGKKRKRKKVKKVKKEKEREHKTK